MYAMTNLQGIIGIESVPNFGVTDAIGAFNGEAYVVDELNTASDTKDSMFDFEYRGGKLMSKQYASYEAIADADIDMLTRIRQGLMRAMAVAMEKAVLNGQAGDDGVSSPDARTLFRGLRKFGLEKATVDFGGTTLTEADWRKKILEMVEAGDVYTAWSEISAGNVTLVVDTATYNQFVNFESFTDASKSGMASTLASGRQVATIFGIPVVSNRFFPANVDASGVVSATPGDNTFKTCVLFNTETVKLYNVSGSAIMQTDQNIETQKYIMTASNRVGFSSIFDQTSADPTGFDTTRPNIVTGINISV